MSKPTLDKERFYKELKKYAKQPRLGIQIFMFLDENFRFQLIFDWTSSLPNGQFNPIMTAQLLDMHKIGSHRYIVPDLNVSAVKENITTDFRLFKYLKKWIDNALENYEEEL